MLSQWYQVPTTIPGTKKWSDMHILRALQVQLLPSRTRLPCLVFRMHVSDSKFHSQKWSFSMTNLWSGGQLARSSLYTFNASRHVWRPGLSNSRRIARTMHPFCSGGAIGAGFKQTQTHSHYPLQVHVNVNKHPAPPRPILHVASASFASASER